MSDLMHENIAILNGEVWESPGQVRGIVQWLDDDYWILVSEPHASADGGSKMVVLDNGDGPMFLSQAGLYGYLTRNGWRKIPARAALID
jgi:hypothetical protein